MQQLVLSLLYALAAPNDGCMDWFLAASDVTLSDGHVHADCPVEQTASPPINAACLPRCLA
jgi:hypothetical protein